MITKYFTKVVVKFEPLAQNGKVARAFLASIPPSMKGSCGIETQVITAAKQADPVVQVTFKDKKSISADPRKLTVQELFSTFDLHSRKLALKESIEQ